VSRCQYLVTGESASGARAAHAEKHRARGETGPCGHPGTAPTPMP
jgi:hypothetical protein